MELHARAFDMDALKCSNRLLKNALRCRKERALARFLAVGWGIGAGTRRFFA
jgi:hypothetical protein